MHCSVQSTVIWLIHRSNCSRKPDFVKAESGYLFYGKDAYTMTSYIPLGGVWEFLDDQPKRFMGFPPDAQQFHDTIVLPSTTALAKKGEPNPAQETDFLTEVYPYHGNAWFRTVAELPTAYRRSMKLYMERTRISELWVNGMRIGTRDSLCTAHVYDLSDFAACTRLELCIRVDNTEYPTKGGHMTSRDTQTNWNGILGAFYLQCTDRMHSIERIKVVPDAAGRRVRLELHTACTANSGWISGQWEDMDGEVGILEKQEISLQRGEDGIAYADIFLGEDAPLWEEHHPVICRMQVELPECEKADVCFGLTDFRAVGLQFTNHGKPVFLRGKHDAMLFPLTGAAPMDREAWMQRFRIAKSYGINHYRFHTCCPPEAAFCAADLLGIYLEPEIPFWGSIYAPEDAQYNAQEQGYLIAEGKRILEEFGNHPSFAMFSLGNELWGSTERIAEILRYFKQSETRILFTQGCNNFQFSPVILPEDDFFVGVRLSRERLLRGSYAMCDAPLGHVQTEKPSAMHSYDTQIQPDELAVNAQEAQAVQIQHGTSVRTVEMECAEQPLMPKKPVVLHEIGQYCVYPDFSEIDKYTGVLQARNFEVFRQRLAEKGMQDMAQRFFLCSGKLAVQCYKEEIEAAMRSETVAGFQLLDLQDFSGQGTALVGILDAFMDNKGLISPEEWRGFCSECALLAQFPSYVLQSGEEFAVQLAVRYYGDAPLCGTLRCKLTTPFAMLAEIPVKVELHERGLFQLGEIRFTLPEFSRVQHLTLSLCLGDRHNAYALTVMPKQDFPALTAQGVCVTEEWETVRNALHRGEKVLFLPRTVKASVKGTYCTDFWCYPMFRQISEEMGKPVPVGTLGLSIAMTHPALKDFGSELWSTPQWYEIVTHADCAILDGTELVPIVQMIDNFERNHRLGLLFECRVGSGSLLVCTARLGELTECPAAAQFARGLLSYVSSCEFSPEKAADVAVLGEIFG